MIAPKIITEKTEVGWDLEPGDFATVLAPHATKYKEIIRD